jgi:hypothetical protein
VDHMDTMQDHGKRRVQSEPSTVPAEVR